MHRGNELRFPLIFPGDSLCRSFDISNHYWPSPSCSSSNCGIAISRKSTGDLSAPFKFSFLIFFFLFFIFSFGNDEKFTRQTRTHTAGPVSSSEEADFCVLCLLQRSRRVCGACNWSRTARGPTETIYRFDFIMTAGRNKTRKIEMEKSGEREREKKNDTVQWDTQLVSLFPRLLFRVITTTHSYEDPHLFFFSFSFSPSADPLAYK